MGYTNIPPTMSELYWEQDKRIGRLETAVRFNAPNLNFATSTPTNPRSGDIYFDTNINVLKYWNGTTWVEIADNLYGTSILNANATWKSIDNNLTYTGNPAVITYQRIGKMITANLNISCSTVTNFGTGQYYITVPAGFPAIAKDLVANGWIDKAGVTYSIFGTMAAGSSNMYFWQPTSNGASDAMTYNKPVVLTTATKIAVTGVAILA